MRTAAASGGTGAVDGSEGGDRVGSGADEHGGEGARAPAAGEDGALAGERADAARAHAAAPEASGVTPPGRALSRAAAEAVLLHEARLIDERRFEEWLALFTADARYVLPGGDDSGDMALIDDDRATMEDRVARLRSPGAHAQSPPSRTLHVISGVELEDVAGYGRGHGAEAVSGGVGPTGRDALAEVRVHSVCVVYEARLGQVRSFAGRCLHLLRASGGAEAGPPGQGEWRIAAKTVWLVDRDQPLYNLTFLI